MSSFQNYLAERGLLPLKAMVIELHCYCKHCGSRVKLRKRHFKEPDSTLYECGYCTNSNSLLDLFNRWNYNYDSGMEQWIDDMNSTYLDYHERKYYEKELKEYINGS